MIHKEGSFKGINKYNLFWQAWLPEIDSKAILIVIHGLAEHTGRYGNLINYFVPRDYAIYAFDLEGHGRSEGIRGYVDCFSCYLDDMRTFIDIVKRENPHKRLIMIGNSMGGQLAVAYAADNQKELAGLIVSAPLLKIGLSVSPIHIVVAKILSAIMPKIGVAVLDAREISKDKVVVDAYMSDPLVYRGKTTARLGAEILNLINRLPRRFPDIRLPILIMYGTEDRLTNLAGSDLLNQKVGSQDKMLKVYKGLYHEIFNEPEHEKVMADVEEWLEAHL